MRLADLPKEKLEELYVNLLRTDSEIASIFGVTQDAVLCRRKIFGITTINPTERKNKRDLLGEIIVNIEGAEKSRHKEITKEILEDLYIRQRKTDMEIGKMFNVSDVAISAKRKKLGVSTIDRNSEKHQVVKNLTNEELKNIYYSNTNEVVGLKLGVSKTVWHPEVKDRDIESKNEYRISSYPPLTEKQTRLIIGGMLGDAGITKDNSYYEGHALNQTMYLKHKHELLKPYSLDIYKCTREKDTGYEFSTCAHPNFKIFRDFFYKEGIGGKIIPLEFIQKYWSDDILAYWFFDDGHFDAGTFTIANGCKIPGQLEALVSYISGYYGYTFEIKPGDSVDIVQIPNDFKGIFIDLLLKEATPDLYYKIPEGHLTQDMIKKIDFSISELEPKFVRLMDDQQKSRVKEVLFNKLNDSPFPFNDYTEDRLKDLLNQIAKSSGSLQGKIIKVKNYGNSFCEYFFPNFWSCFRHKSKSPLKLWKDPEILKSLIEISFQGDSFRPNSFRSILKQTAVSLFKPTVAKFIYDRFSPDDAIVYDFSSGFGGRLTGFFLSKNCSEYIGVEPNPETYDNLLRMTQYLKANIGEKKVSIYKQGSEDYCPEDLIAKVDIAFSSPPYFDLEHYGNDPNQSIIKYPRYEDWVSEYFEKTISNCWAMLKKGGYFVVCLNNYHKLNQDLLKICVKKGFRLAQKLFSLSLSRGLMQGGENKRTYSDPIYVFEKTGCPARLVDNIIEEDTIENESIEKGDEIVIKKGPKTYVNFDVIIEKFKEVAPLKGISRDTYKDPSILGVESYQIEHHFKGWNAFIIKCGFKPQYEAHDKEDIVRDYFNECLKNNEALTFYKYGMSKIGFLEGEEGRKLGIRYTLRMKRLFNSGKPYNYLIEELKSIAFKPGLWDEFLKKLS
jgi:tRNA1(Val) A37 N6-methylase TrmN6